MSKQLFLCSLNLCIHICTPLLKTLSHVIVNLLKSLPHFSLYQLCISMFFSLLSVFFSTYSAFLFLQPTPTCSSALCILYILFSNPAWIYWYMYWKIIFIFRSPIKYHGKHPFCKDFVHVSHICELDFIIFWPRGTLLMV
jgi:hypothetical protein